ncbi:MAG: PadR family transcriptional regulator [Oscillospiraceae bacterium]
MSIDKSLLTGSTTTLILKLLEEKDMYGYEMIEILSKKSDHTFDLKAGTLYPILHNLEKNELVESYEEKADNERNRKYYHLTSKGKNLLKEKHKEWIVYSDAVNKVLNGGLNYARI